MGFKCGIVGLPNVGKSTLFNALIQSRKAQVANFPFCTIDPNVGSVTVPDRRINIISNISKSKKNHQYINFFCRHCGIGKGSLKRRGPRK